MLKNKREQSCENCMYSKVAWESSNWLHCRRFPPHNPQIHGSDSSAKFPLVTVEDWCGEHQPK